MLLQFNQKTLIIPFLLSIAFGLMFSASAQTGKIIYPVTELDGCANQQECKAYCSVASNYSKCAAFAQKNGLTVEIPDDKKGVFVAMEKGESPGQCKDEASCRNYCEDIDHIGECLDFVEKFNLESSDNLKEMRQVSDAKKAGTAFPGNCKTKESCMKYCEGSTHSVECMEFALKTGLIPKEDVESVGKILPFLKSGGKLPGGCTTKESCDKYCGSDTHTNECMDFAVGAGFMNREEAEIVKKTGGKGPGNCKSREACDNYCKDETHTDECIEFAVKAGFISAEDAENAKKLGITSGGPGDCKGKAECESFCVLPENQETCSNWAKEHGMDMGGGPGGQGGHGTADECAKYGGNWDGKICDMGANECVKQGGSLDGTTCKFPEGQFPGIECENPPCGSPEGGQATPPDSRQTTPQQRFSGPGGCKTPDECQAYCKANPDACRGSTPPEGGQQYQNAPSQNFDNAAAECGKQGGSWEGDKCYFRDPTMQNIGVDRGGEECVKQGGNWTGSNCNFPPPPTQTGPPSGDEQQQYPLLLRYSPFAAILNFILGR